MKRITITPGVPKELEGYKTWLKKRNFEYRVLDVYDQLVDNEILLLCGGADIGKKPERDKREIELIYQALIKNIPILGICRGMQIVNMFLQGSLHDDLDTNVKHCTSIKDIPIGNKKPSEFHSIKFDDRDLIMEVNSRHHQGIKSIADGLVPIAKSEDELVEAAEHLYTDMLLVQWHPELEEVFDTDAEIFVSNWIHKILTKQL